MPSILDRKKIEIDPTKIYICLSSFIAPNREVAKAGDRRHGRDAMVTGWPSSWAPDGATTDELDALHFQRFGSHRVR
jgi:hypothetical protein